MPQPNKRLKLTGGDRLKGSGVLCPWRGTDERPLLLRRRAGRPQLKRDPLGGALPPRAPPSVGWLPRGNFPTQGRARTPSHARCARPLVKSAPSNMRLKLTGGDRFKGSGVLCPWRSTAFVQRPCAGGRVARSLTDCRNTVWMEGIESYRLAPRYEWFASSPADGGHRVPAKDS